MTASPPRKLDAGTATGRPAGFAPSAPAAYWIWQGPRGGWRIRTTTAKGDHTFRGRVRGSTADIVRVRPSRVEFRDRIWSTDDRSWAFSFRTKGHADGFTFFTRDEGCVEFDLQLAGGPAPKKVFVGRREVDPGTGHFVACPPGASAERAPNRR